MSMVWCFGGGVVLSRWGEGQMMKRETWNKRRGRTRNEGEGVKGYKDGEVGCRQTGTGRYETVDGVATAQNLPPSQQPPPRRSLLGMDAGSDMETGSHD